MIGEVVMLLSLKIKWKSEFDRVVILVKEIFENCWEESDFIVSGGSDAIMFSKILFSKIIVSDYRFN